MALVTCCTTVSLSCFLAASLRRSFFMVCKLQNVFQIIVSPDLYSENWARLTTHTHTLRTSESLSLYFSEKKGGEFTKNLFAKGHGRHFCRFISLLRGPLSPQPPIRPSSCESSPSHKQSSYRAVASHPTPRPLSSESREREFCRAAE